MISLIAIIGKNRALGKDNKLIWNIPADMNRFKKLTMGHTVIMGRKTYDSINHPLKGRFNIVITRQKDYSLPDCLVVHSLKDALNKAAQEETNKIFIIGGAEIYQQAIPYANRIYLTLVEDSPAADTFFPDYSEFKKVVFKKSGLSNNLKYTFFELIR